MTMPVASTTTSTITITITIIHPHPGPPRQPRRLKPGPVGGRPEQGGWAAGVSGPMGATSS